MRKILQLIMPAFLLVGCQKKYPFGEKPLDLESLNLAENISEILPKKFQDNQGNYIIPRPDGSPIFLKKFSTGGEIQYRQTEWKNTDNVAVFMGYNYQKISIFATPAGEIKYVGAFTINSDEKALDSQIAKIISKSGNPGSYKNPGNESFRTMVYDAGDKVFCLSFCQYPPNDQLMRIIVDGDEQLSLEKGSMTSVISYLAVINPKFKQEILKKIDAGNFFRAEVFLQD